MKHLTSSLTRTFTILRRQIQGCKSAGSRICPWILATCCTHVLYRLAPCPTCRPVQLCPSFPLQLCRVGQRVCSHAFRRRVWSRVHGFAFAGTRGSRHIRRRCRKPLAAIRCVAAGSHARMFSSATGACCCSSVAWGCQHNYALHTCACANGPTCAARACNTCCTCACGMRLATLCTRSMPMPPFRHLPKRPTIDATALR